MRRWLLLFMLMAVTTGAIARQPVATDTSTVQVRSFSKTMLNELKAQKAFQYENKQEPVMSLWDRFWSWFWWKITQLLKTNEGKTTMWALFILFGVSTILFFVMKVMGMNKAGLFGRNGGSKLSYTTATDDINNISFDEAIEEAIAQRNFRLAVRLLYLQVLKAMADRGYIKWQLNKTNTDYIGEVNGRNWQPVFRKLTDNFEYTWYGEANISSETFNELHSKFKQFNSQL